MDPSSAFVRAVLSASALFVSHLVCTLIIMRLDLSGKWKEYALTKDRSVRSASDYLIGLRSFLGDLAFVFIPALTLVFWHKGDEIDGASDSALVSLIKLTLGYIAGKLWAAAVHYALHHPALYRFHKKHHCNTKVMVANIAWEDSWVEYCLMEIPSFALAVLLFPTHFKVHLAHFALHGYDGAANHSGFAAPGFLGYIFNSEYHYYHREYDMSIKGHEYTKSPLYMLC